MTLLLQSDLATAHYELTMWEEKESLGEPRLMLA